MLSTLPTVIMIFRYLILNLHSDHHICFMIYKNFAKNLFLYSIVFLSVFLSGNFLAFSQVSSQNKKDPCILNHLDVGISVGSTGAGLDLALPLTEFGRVRVGVDWLPKISVPMSFNLDTYSDGMPTGNFNNVASMLYDMTGIEIDETVHMKGKASMWNFKLLIDFFPIPKNKHWYITAGFYAGTSMIAKAINAGDEKPTLVGLNIYNRAYEYFTNLESIYDVPLGGGNYMDPDKVEELQEKFNRYGRMGIHIGDFKDGKPYIMDPAPDGSLVAKAFVNHFKPYLGIGYTTDIDKKKRWHFGLDLGALFWGGAPDVINHDYNSGKNVNFTKDLTNIKGKVGDYMKVVKALPVYPMVNIRFSYSIF